jgi:hypothetical protein
MLKSNKSSYQIRNPLFTVALPSKHVTIHFRVSGDVSSNRDSVFDGVCAESL